MFHASKLCFTAPNALSGAFSQRRRRLGEKQKLWICFDFCTQDRRKFNTLLHNYRSVRHICCLSNTDEKIFCAPHAPQTLRTALSTLKSRHFRITATFGDDISPLASRLAAKTACLAALPLDFALHTLPRPISASLAAPPHSANADAMTAAAVARVFFEEMSIVIKTVYPLYYH